MFWMKTKEAAAADGVAEQVGREAEGLYRSGKMHCAEAVLQAVKDRFRPDLPDDVLGVAAGFGGGSGSGCLCGAVTGGTIAFGLAVRDDRKCVMKLTKELHAWFQQQYGSSCCRVIREKDKGVCPGLTGAVAGKVAQLLVEERSEPCT